MDAGTAGLKQIRANRIGKTDHIPVAAEVFRHKNGAFVFARKLRGIGVNGSKAVTVFGKQRRLGPAKPIDALLNITHHKTAARFGNGTENGILNGIHVLVFVNENAVKILGKPPRQLGAVAFGGDQQASYPTAK